MSTIKEGQTSQDSGRPKADNYYKFRAMAEVSKSVPDITKPKKTRIDLAERTWDAIESTTLDNLREECESGRKGHGNG